MVLNLNSARWGSPNGYDSPVLTPFANFSSIKNQDYEGNSAISFKDINGDIKFIFPKSSAFLESERDSVFSQHIISVTKRLFIENNERLFMAGVPFDWLVNQPHGSIVIDPDTEILQPDASAGKDATILMYSSDPSYNHRNYGTWSKLYREATRPWRGLIKFDLSHLPVNAKVDTAFLKLWPITHYNGDIYAHQLAHHWLEGSGSNVSNSSSIDGVTWYERWYENNTFESNNPWDEDDADWQTAGGDYGGSVASVSVSSSTPFILPINATVEDWIENPDENHGLLLKTDESNSDCVWVHSSDSTTPSSRPRLEVTYSVATRVTYYIRDASGQVIATYEK